MARLAGRDRMPSLLEAKAKRSKRVTHWPSKMRLGCRAKKEGDPFESPSSEIRLACGPISFPEPQEPGLQPWALPRALQAQGASRPSAPQPVWRQEPGP